MLPPIFSLHDLEGIYKHKRQESRTAEHELGAPFALRGSHLSL